MKSFKLPEHPFFLDSEGVQSEIFGDRFHSREGVLEEVQHVFINGNNLLERWHSGIDFTIGELGFGFGASFICAGEAWANSGKNCKNFLHYFSVEGFPVSNKALKDYWYNSQTAKLNQKHSSLLSDLVRQYPYQLQGTHRLYFEKERIILTLSFLPVHEALYSQNFTADAWFLDGFSPSKNPDMWSKSVFDLIFKKTKFNGTLSTYTVASEVKNNALSSGFLIKTLKGFGKKREMLFGEKETSPAPFHIQKRRPRVAIIGGGLAGASVCHALLKRNIEVKVFEQKKSPGEKASGNKAAVIMPHLSSVPDYLCRYFLTGYLFTNRVLENLSHKNCLTSYQKTGVIRLTNVNKWKTISSRIKQLGLEQITQELQPESLKTVFGEKLSVESALYFPDAGSINPLELTNKLFQCLNKNDFLFERKVISTETKSDFATLTLDNNKSFQFDYIIFASAFESTELPDISWLPIEKIKGQLFTASIRSNKFINTPLCYDGYVIPLSDNKLLIGATYEHNAHETAFDQEVTIDLISRLKDQCPDISVESYSIEGRVCFRTTSPDRMPLVGMIPLSDGSETRYLASLGHGSRGTVSCLLAGEILASHILEEPLPIELDLLKQLAPERYLEREKRKGIPLEEVYPASFLWRK
ncbi:MAG TPA: FAD-dependent 5-carboxymethylaminomethyl-2-thiouridine(34) oxidoreductase MnmC [Oligoflexia bacterium]|nr:FAD-dependent 5-carboxymethylaminomethyl-2-thiouridine(34) oxidoreductase MnmC [Oligoflexia bacterium]HMP49696.1 FAD-dependent 5-carboxymethylaminomethyl-2-thiouridine(34) oxidoreductase MnmC [Oligoflexia bacterium]